MTINKPLIDFPCSFPLKVIGLMQDGFAQNITQIIKTFDINFDEKTIEMYPSKQSKYLALRINVYVHNQEQLDNIYKALSSYDLVKFVI